MDGNIHGILTGGLKILFNHNWDNAPELLVYIPGLNAILDTSPCPSCFFSLNIR